MLLLLKKVFKKEYLKLKLYGGQELDGTIDEPLNGLRETNGTLWMMRKTLLKANIKYS